MDFKPVAPLTGDEYQMRAIRTMAPETDLMNVALGLAGEAGEFCDHLKKNLYHGHDLDQDHLIKELGDQLWYIAMGCKLLNVRLSDVMAQNINKLNRRYPDGFSSENSRNREEFLPAGAAGKVTVPGHITQIDKNIIPTYWGGAPVANESGAITFEFSPNFPSTAPERIAPEQVGECGPEMKDRSAESAQALWVVEEDERGQDSLDRTAGYRQRAYLHTYKTPDELEIYDPDLDVFFRAYRAGGKTWVTLRGEDDVKPLDPAVRAALDDIYAPKAVEEPLPTAPVDVGINLDNCKYASALDEDLQQYAAESRYHEVGAPVPAGNYNEWKFPCECVSQTKNDEGRVTITTNSYNENGDYTGTTVENRPTCFTKTWDDGRTVTTTCYEDGKLVSESVERRDVPKWSPFAAILHAFGFLE